MTPFAWSVPSNPNAPGDDIDLIPDAVLLLYAEQLTAGASDLPVPTTVNPSRAAALIEVNISSFAKREAACEARRSLGAITLRMAGTFCAEHEDQALRTGVRCDEPDARTRRCTGEIVKRRIAPEAVERISEAHDMVAPDGPSYTYQCDTCWSLYSKSEYDELRGATIAGADGSVSCYQAAAFTGKDRSQIRKAAFTYNQIEWAQTENGVVVSFASVLDWIARIERKKAEAHARLVAA